MSNYSKRVHCTVCGNMIPKSESGVLDGGKAGAVRVCETDYKVAQARIQAAKDQMNAQMNTALREAKER